MLNIVQEFTLNTMEGVKYSSGAYTKPDLQNLI